MNNNCPSCGALYNVASKDIGRRLKCKKCNSALTVTDAGLEMDDGGPPPEDAREELIAIVAKLEAGQVPLEDSMQLWRRGEALAAHCSRWLDSAQAEIEGATRGRSPAASTGADDEAAAQD